MKAIATPLWLKSKIGRHFALYTTSLGVVMALILSFLISYQQYREEISLIKKELNTIVTANKSFMEQSLWILNVRALNLVLRGFLLDGDIVFFQITDENGKTITSNGIPNSDNNIIKTVSLYHQTEGENIFLGKLTIEASKLSALSKAQSMFFITLFQSVLIMAIILVSIIFIFWHLVSRHLSTIQEYTKGISLVEHQGVLKLDRPINKRTKNDELASTVDAINFMYRNAVKTYQKLEARTKEKNILLKEIYHRTKNNMQVINSLLMLQGARYPGEEMQKLVDDMSSRIKAMSLVHELLYESEDLSHISLKYYIEKLASLILKCFSVSSDKVSVEIEMDDMELLIDTAVPLGLVLNELITNSLKHAFPEEQRGKITIGISRRQSGIIEIVFSDNGTGFSDEINFENKETFGLKIIKGLIEQQMNGTVRFESKYGLTCYMEISDILYEKRI